MHTSERKDTAEFWTYFLQKPYTQKQKFNI